MGMQSRARGPVYLGLRGLYGHGAGCWFLPRVQITSLYTSSVQSKSKKVFKIAVVLVLLCGLIPGNASAAAAVKEGATCPKVGSKIKVSKSVTLVCTTVGTKKNASKWKRSAKVTTVPKAVASTSTVPVISTSAKIVIKGFAYVVASGLKKGDVVSISNQDSVAHTVTFDSNSADDPIVIGIGGGYSIKKSKVTESVVSGKFDVVVPGNSTAVLPSLDVGTYNFYCSYHPSMRGVLVVK